MVTCDATIRLVNYEQIGGMLAGYEDIYTAVERYLSRSEALKGSPLLNARLLAHFPDAITPDAEVDMLALAYSDGTVVYTDPCVDPETKRAFCKEIEDKTAAKVVAISKPKARITKLFHDIDNYRVQKRNAESIARTKHAENQQYIDWDDT